MSQEKSSHTLVRHVGSVSLATLISRVLGYARDALVAAAFGGGTMTDVFYAAFRLPNLLRRVLGEGPLTSAFVPVFAEELTHNRRQAAEEFFQTLFTALFALLFVLVVLGIVFAPVVTHLVAWGFKQTPDKFNYTVELTRLTFPFVLFVCLAAITSGALNSLGHFFLPALAPAMLSVSEILFILLFAKAPWWSSPLQGLAISAAVGGLLHFAVLVPLMFREGIRPRWRWNPFHPKVIQVAQAILPAVWGLSLDQVNAFVDTICASFLVQGSVTALYNSNRLMQFPLALFGIAMSTAALPALSVCAAKQDWRGVKDTLNFSLRLVFFNILPATVGLIVLGVPIVQLLFQHGKFTAEATLLTYSALAAYCLGLPAYASVKVLVSAFYAMKDTRTPVRVATWCLLINLTGNVTLMWKWGVGGLAFATAFASCCNALALFWILRKKLGLLGGKRIFKSYAQAAAAGLVMAAIAGAIAFGFAGSLLWRVPAAVLSGAAAYYALAWVFRMEEFEHIKRMVLRRETPLESPTVAIVED